LYGAAFPDEVRYTFSVETQLTDEACEQETPVMHVVGLSTYWLHCKSNMREFAKATCVISTILLELANIIFSQGKTSVVPSVPSVASLSAPTRPWLAMTRSKP
jgi:hypothetical protein